MKVMQITFSQSTSKGCYKNMKKRYYVVDYINNEKEVNDLFNTIETLFLIAFCRIDSHIQILNIKRGEFYE